MNTLPVPLPAAIPGEVREGVTVVRSNAPPPDALVFAGLLAGPPAPTQTAPPGSRPASPEADSLDAAAADSLLAAAAWCPLPQTPAVPPFPGSAPPGPAVPVPGTQPAPGTGVLPPAPEDLSTLPGTAAPASAVTPPAPEDLAAAPTVAPPGTETSPDAHQPLPSGHATSSHLDPLPQGRAAVALPPFSSPDTMRASVPAAPQAEEGAAAPPLATPTAAEGATAPGTTETAPEARPATGADARPTPNAAVLRSLASLPEPLLFTVEFDTSAAASLGRATGAVGQIMPPTASPEIPMAPVALPREIEVQLQDPEGPVRLTVGRDKRDVNVRVEVPTGLFPAVQEARHPVRAALAEHGLELGRYDVSSGQQEPGGEQRSARRGPHGESSDQGAVARTAPAKRTEGPSVHHGLLDRRA